MLRAYEVRASIPGWLAIDFKDRLHDRSKDGFWVYKSAGYAHNDKDILLLGLLMKNLLARNSGVNKIHVQAYGLAVYYDESVSSDDIVERILAAMRFVANT